jgi:FAD/FMN-containing dehydrogenase
VRNLNKKRRRYLRELFGSRVNFDPTERGLYGHDIAAMPSLFKPLIGDTTPAAVVQPADGAELVELVKWAGREGVPLTPRGKATSGYGGVIPVRQGVVVDFYRM